MKCSARKEALIYQTRANVSVQPEKMVRADDYFVFCFVCSILIMKQKKKNGRRGPRAPALDLYPFAYSPRESRGTFVCRVRYRRPKLNLKVKAITSEIRHRSLHLLHPPTNPIIRTQTLLSLPLPPLLLFPPVILLTMRPRLHTPLPLFTPLLPTSTHMSTHPMRRKQTIIQRRERPVRGIGRRARGDREQLGADDGVREVVHVEVVLVVPEGVLDLFAGDDEAEEDETLGGWLVRVVVREGVREGGIVRMRR